MNKERPADAEFIAAWHGKETTDEVAERLQLSRNTVLRAWRRLQYGGDLPCVHRDDHSIPLETDEQRKRRHRQQDSTTNLGQYGSPRCTDLDGLDPLLEALERDRREREGK